MSKLLYIAGPYTAPTNLGIEANINAARQSAIWCAENRIYYICPHLNSAQFHLWALDVPYGFYLAMDFEIISRCDALLVLPNWGLSRGTREELLLADKLKMPVFYYPDDCEAVITFAMEGDYEESIYSS